MAGGGVSGGREKQRTRETSVRFLGFNDGISSRLPPFFTKLTILPVDLT